MKNERIERKKKIIATHAHKSGSQFKYTYSKETYDKTSDVISNLKQRNETTIAKIKIKKKINKHEI